MHAKKEEIRHEKEASTSPCLDILGPSHSGQGPCFPITTIPVCFHLTVVSTVPCWVLCFLEYLIYSGQSSQAGVYLADVCLVG